MSPLKLHVGNALHAAVPCESIPLPPKPGEQTHVTPSAGEVLAQRELVIRSEHIVVVVVLEVVFARTVEVRPYHCHTTEVSP